MVVSVRSNTKNRLRFITEIRKISNWIKPKFKPLKAGDQ